MLSRAFDLTRHISESGRCQNHFLAGLITASKIRSCRQTLPCCQTEMRVNPGFSEDQEKTMKCCLPFPSQPEHLRCPNSDEMTDWPLCHLKKKRKLQLHLAILTGLVGRPGWPHPFWSCMEVGKKMSDHGASGPAAQPQSLAMVQHQST